MMTTNPNLAYLLAKERVLDTMRETEDERLEGEAVPDHDHTAGGEVLIGELEVHQRVHAGFRQRSGGGFGFFGVDVQAGHGQRGGGSEGAK